jgi:hypothetical protein
MGLFFDAMILTSHCHDQAPRTLGKTLAALHITSLLDVVVPVKAADRWGPLLSAGSAFPSADHHAQDGAPCKDAGQLRIGSGLTGEMMKTV